MQGSPEHVDEFQLLGFSFRVGDFHRQEFRSRVRVKFEACIPYHGGVVPARDQNEFYPVEIESVGEGFESDS
jgi:hypothetical protein